MRNSIFKCAATLTLILGAIASFSTSAQAQIVVELSGTSGSSEFTLSLSGTARARDFRPDGAERNRFYFGVNGSDALPTDMINIAGVLAGNTTVTNETTNESRRITEFQPAAESNPLWDDKFALNLNSPLFVKHDDVISVSGSATFSLERWGWTFDDLTAGSHEIYTINNFENNLPLEPYQTLIIKEANTFPVSMAGPDQTVDCTGPDGAIVALDGTASSDPDGDSLAYEWSVPAGVLLDDPTSSTPTGLFPIGVTTATLTVTDGKGGLDVDDVVITVIDNAPPEVAATTDIGAIWPPKHDMVPVTVSVYATDHCTAPEDLILGSVTIQSSEPDDAEGLSDGETTGDVDGQDGFTSPVDVTDLLVYDPATASFVGTIWLRAERDSEGFGRSYSINATVLDSSNNIAESSCVVVVPHDRRKK